MSRHLSCLCNGVMNGIHQCIKLDGRYLTGVVLKGNLS